MIGMRLPEVVLATLLLSAGACRRDDRPRWTRDSEFVFSGTIVLPRAATIDADDVANLAIVRVDDVLDAVPVFRGLKGGQVTVQLQDPARAAAGQSRVFFTKSWQFGDGISLIEIGSVAAPSGREMQTMRGDIERFRQEQSDSELGQRLRSAELVVIGRVAAVRPAGLPRGATEHDPDWQEADIEITSVLRGTSSARTVTILFPGSDDVMWYGWPKYEKGMQGIWLLRPFAMGAQRLARLTTPRRDDFRPAADEARIRRLLK